MLAARYCGTPCCPSNRRLSLVAPLHLRRYLMRAMPTSTHMVGRAVFSSALRGIFFFLHVEVIFFVLHAFVSHKTKQNKQIAVRLVLGLLCWLSFRRFNSAVALRFGDSPAGWAAAVWALQFHLPFYLSRTLPNVFALCVILLALQVSS